MATGLLIAESLRTGAVVADLRLTVTKLSRVEITEPTPDQPGTWTLLEFEFDGADAPRLAEHFAAALATPGWYVGFDADGRKYVVYAGKVFTYPRGDATARAEAAAYGRAHGVPRHSSTGTADRGRARADTALL